MTASEYSRSVMSSTLNRDNVEFMAREQQTKFVHSCIEREQKGLARLCDSMASYTRKTAKLRDRGDDLAEIIYKQSANEGNSGKRALCEAGECLSLIQDFRQTLIMRLENKVVDRLSTYGEECKKARNNLNAAASSVQKELANQRRLRKQAGTQAVSQARNELQKSSEESVVVLNQLQHAMESFEEKRLRDTKEVLKDFVNVEMVFLSKALEIYTDVYRSIETWNIESDLEDFRSKLRPPDSISRTPKSTEAKEPDEKSESGSEEQETDSEDKDDDYDSSDYDDETTTAANDTMSKTRVQRM